MFYPQKSIHFGCLMQKTIHNN